MASGGAGGAGRGERRRRTPRLTNFLRAQTEGGLTGARLKRGVDAVLFGHSKAADDPSGEAWWHDPATFTPVGMLSSAGRRGSGGSLARVFSATGMARLFPAFDLSGGRKVVIGVDRTRGLVLQLELAPPGSPFRAAGFLLTFVVSGTTTAARVQVWISGSLDEVRLEICRRPEFDEVDVASSLVRQYPRAHFAACAPTLC